MKDIAIYGAGGFGREVACLIKRINRKTPTWNLIGFFDDGIAPGSRNEYGRVIGNLSALNAWPTALDVVIAIGSPDIVRRIVGSIANKNLSFPNIISPDTIFLDPDNYRIGCGNILCPRCLISCNVTIGDFNIFNGNISVGHDTNIGSYNVFMPAVNISGGVNIGDENFMGIRSIVLQYRTIGNRVRVGANSVILRNTQDDNLYMGNPATKVKL